MLLKYLRVASVVGMLFGLFSCMASKKNHEQRLILQGIDSAKLPAVSLPVNKIQKGDLLTILIYSDNKEATEIFNQPQTGGASNNTGSNMGNQASMGRGYQVDANGQIYLHSIGPIQAAGLTKAELANQISEKLKPFLLNPYTVVRYANPRINVMGEVQRPGVIELTDQKLSVLDAIGFAGDMTPFGRRDNVLVIREQDGQRVVGRLDLRKSDFYDSPFFYLQQNDLVYVEPNRRKPTGNDQLLMRNITIGTSILSVLALVISFINL